MKIILASNNKGKIKEFRTLLGDKYEIYSLSDVGFNDEIDENGKSFAENAMIKVNAVYKRFPEYIVIADDSGICANALNGSPGIYSARYSGVHGDDEANIIKLVKELSDKKDKTAYYLCAVAVRLPDGNEFTVEGRCNGIVIDEKRGANGFGYDPIFFIPELNQTMAELSEDDKNKISHRGKALEKMLIELNRRIK